jgi:RNA polymerase sigma-70 factor (ECF subfamily)
MNQSIHSWVTQYGDTLYRYALTRVNNRSDAQDLVQETFLAAYKSGNFEGRSKTSTYLIGILRHKIMDHFRKVYRHKQHFSENEMPRDQTEDDDLNSRPSPQGEIFDSMFIPAGCWAEPVADWGRTPENALLDSEFNQILDGCLEKLPDTQRSAFMMRTLEEQKTEDICKDFEISPTNLGVLLFRARTQLKKCIEISWFKGKEEIS